MMEDFNLLAQSTDLSYVKEFKERYETNDPKLMERFQTAEEMVWGFFEDPERFFEDPNFNPLTIGINLLVVDQLSIQLFPKHPSGKDYLNRDNPMVVFLVWQAKEWLKQNGKRLVDGEVVIA